ncbi:MAG: c-type cytochrome [Anaerolineae bacterium]|nr:MAG: c-type cytochrome [Anaerolineae bacterium]
MTRKVLIPLAILLIAVPSLAQTPPPSANPWHLRRFEQPGQITLYDGPAGASTTGKPVELGDFDGDNCGDVAITGQNARGAAGQVRVVFGLCNRWGHSFNLFEDDPNRPPMVSIYGAQPGDMFGTELYHGDFNGDGYDDLLVGAQNALSADLSLAGVGAAYIIFGRADFPSLDTIEMSQPPANVLRVYGTDFQDRLGIWVEGGDFNGDGYHDALIGANQADGIDNKRSNSGEVFVLYGSPTMWQDYGPIMTLSETTRGVTRIVGADYDDLLGSTVYGADLNMDGIDDLILSAALWRGSAGVGGLAQGGGDGPGNTRYNAGETYVIFGSRNLPNRMIDLQLMVNAAGEPTNQTLSVVYGPEGGDVMGEEIVVGDLNGDGWNDLVVGSLATPGRNNVRIDGGEGWVIYGSEDFPGQMFDLAVPGTGVAVYAPEGDNKGGDTMLIADMDRDGIGDLLYGMPNANSVDERGGSVPNAGVLAVLYGTQESFPTTDGLIDLAAPPYNLRLDFILGVDPFDMSAYGMAIGDVNQDGWPDIAMNGMNGDGYNNRITDGGEIYIINGREFTAYVNSPHTTAVPTAESTSAALPTAVPLPTRTSDPNATPLSIEQGEVLFTINCAGCHGTQGEGIEGIAVTLAQSEFVDTHTDFELLEFIRVGRPATDPNSLIGRPMPASGGNPNLTDSELLAIILYIRTLD